MGPRGRGGHVVTEASVVTRYPKSRAVAQAAGKELAVSSGPLLSCSPKVAITFLGTAIVLPVLGVPGT